VVGRRIANRTACVETGGRQFMLQRVPASARPFARAEIEQGWLPGLRLIERVQPLSPDRAVTFRSSRPAVGGEPSPLEGEVDAALFETIWPLTEGRRLRKRRHVVSDYGLEWEIDEYLDRDLVLLEVPVDELGAGLPDWLQPYVVREVTGEGGYTPRALAR
jgi:hypothetical protein